MRQRGVEWPVVLRCRVVLCTRSFRVLVVCVVCVACVSGLSARCFLKILAHGGGVPPLLERKSVSASERRAHCSSACIASASDGQRTPGGSIRMSETLFVKVERVRRLHSARLVEVDVHRGEDGSFGIGLSDENVVTNFHHDTNAASLQLGDQVCKVDSVSLVRERLAHLVQRQFADVQQV